MSIQSIVGGTAEGTVLKSAQPINFLGAVDAKTGRVTDKDHELYDQDMRGRILVFPHGTGSSVGAYTVYALKVNDMAPSAMVCNRADASVVSGCAIAGIPLLLVDGDLFGSMHGGDRVTVDGASVRVGARAKPIEFVPDVCDFGADE